MGIPEPDEIMSLLKKIAITVLMVIAFLVVGAFFLGSYLL